MRGELETGLRKVRADARESLEGLQDVAASIRRLESALERIGRAVGSHEGESMAKTGATASFDARLGPRAGLEASPHGKLEEVGNEADVIWWLYSRQWFNKVFRWQVSTKLDVMATSLDGIAKTVGVAVVSHAGNDEEDRRRLKEKLKEVLEIAQRNRIHKITSEKERWLEYVFGICRPDGRIGKRGSRCSTTEMCYLTSQRLLADEFPKLT
jgi:hypothetical protein